MKPIRKSKRGISTVLATLMMIVVAVAGSLVTYAWVMGYLSFTTNKAGAAIQIQSISLDPARTGVTVYIQNVGQGAVQIKLDSSVYVNNVLRSAGSSTDVVQKGDTKALTVTLSAPVPASPDNKLTVKIVALDGTFTEATAYP